jgi:Ribonuclease G/E
VQANELLDYAIWRPGAPDGVGDLHRGRVVARVPAMAGAFVVLDGAEGFLPDSQGGAEATEGDTLGVCITRAAQGGKGPRLSARLAAADCALVGTGPPALLRRGPGGVEQLARLYQNASIVVDDAALAATLRGSLGDRISVADPLFDDALETEIEALADPTVELPAGGRLHVHPTPALVAIDLDTGAATADRRDKSAAQIGFNRAALSVLARQIRLRNLSGAILVDLAGLSARRRIALQPDLASALAHDPLRPRLLGFTALGLAEILRPRVHPPLHELLVGPHAVGLRALRRIATDLAAQPNRLPRLRAAPAIIAALQADPVALPDLALRAGRPLTLRSDPTIAGFSLEISDA